MTESTNATIAAVVTALKSRLGKHVMGNLILATDDDGATWYTTSSLSPEVYEDATQVIDCGPDQEIFEYANGDRYTPESTEAEWIDLAELLIIGRE